MAQMSVNTYSAKDVILSIGGYKIAGWENISISRSVQGFVTVRGIRGKHTRVPTNDSSATIVVSLIQTSPSNDVLTAIHSLDLTNGTGRIALTLKDFSGRSVFNSNEAYILGFPETVFADDFEYRSWSIFCQTTDTFEVGGNTKPETVLADALVSGISGVIGNIF